jgi:hypothetical protein
VTRRLSQARGRSRRLGAPPRLGWRTRAPSLPRYRFAGAGGSSKGAWKSVSCLCFATVSRSARARRNDDARRVSSPASAFASLDIVSLGAQQNVRDSSRGPGQRHGNDRNVRPERPSEKGSAKRSKRRNRRNVTGIGTRVSTDDSTAHHLRYRHSPN